MKKELIKEAESEKLRYEASIVAANKKILDLERRLDNLNNGTDDVKLKAVLESIRLKKIYIEGLISLHNDLTYKLRDIENNKYSNLQGKSKEKLYQDIKKAIKVNEESLRISYKDYYALLHQKLEINCSNITKRKELKSDLKKTTLVAKSITEEEFIDELIKVFRSNNFSNLYDTKDEDLDYSLGQIFLIKYAITQLSKYLDDYDYTPNINRQIRILNDYAFKPSGKNLSYHEFVSSLKNGNLHLCDLDKPRLSYNGAMRLYKHLTFTFFIPKQLGYHLKKYLK